MENTFSNEPLRRNRALGLAFALITILSVAAGFSHQAIAQDQNYDDPPGRVARLGYMEGSVSFQPAGESEWVEAEPNRPMTTGDKLWADQNSRAEVQLGSATIDLAANTGFSFLNLDDRTVQIELSSGTINVRLRELDGGDIFEIDTPNQAFTASEPGRYRVEASENGDYTVLTIRQGAGESTGNGQYYTLHAGQRTTFSGTNSLNAEVQQVGGPDGFDSWADARYRRNDDSPSARYCSRDVVGYEDLDDNGDWQDSAEYGHVWFPRVQAGWAPYRDGHWAWIDPWGWTWVDDDRWGYAPFHYGRWTSISGRWGWIPGPMAVRPVYAPALVAFVGGDGGGFGGNVAWFPLGPREVYVPSYRVTPAYVNRVNVSNTIVNNTTITNVYNTTVVNKTTNITNVTYVNRSVQGAVTAVPQRTFVSAQPVARAAVAVNAREVASVPVSTRAAVSPAREAVLGVHANNANRVAAPPQAVAQRQVIAKAAPPAASASFAAKQQVLQQHPGQPVDRQEMAKLRPASAPAVAVKRAPPAKPATATPAPNGPANQPGNRPGTPAETTNAPAGRPQPNNPPAANNPNPNHAPANRPEPNRPEANQPQPNQPPPNRPANQPTPKSAPEDNRPVQPPAHTDRPSSAQPANQPHPNDRPEPSPPNRPQPNEPSRPEANRPENNRPENNRPEANAPAPNQPEAKHPSGRPSNEPAPPATRETNRPAQPPERNDRPPSAQPSDRRQPNDRSQPNRPEPNDPNRPEATHPSERPSNAASPREGNPPADRRQQPGKPEQQDKPDAAPRTPPRPQTPEEKKRQNDQQKEEQKKHQNEAKPEPPQ